MHTLMDAAGGSPDSLAPRPSPHTLMDGWRANPRILETPPERWPRHLGPRAGGPCPSTGATSDDGGLRHGTSC